VVSNLNEYLDVFSEHIGYPRANNITDDEYYTHVMDRYPSRLSLVKPTKKSFWIDEWNTGLWNRTNMEGYQAAWSGTQKAAVLTAAMNLGVDNMFLWTVNDQLWPDDLTTNTGGFVNGMQKLGVLPSLFESSIPYPPYYAFALLTKYTGKGSTYAAKSEDDFSGVYASCVQLEDGNWTVIVVNAGFMDVPVSVQFEKAIGKTFYRHSYNPSTIKPTTAAKVPAADKKYTGIKSTINDTLSGGMVAVYTTITH
jgi:hypothetical protein